ncbi:hypothetical protein Bca52824_052019 [Brassica carinata]|uniref:Agenet domain-containing protein n=1 Tax=Brassica carinata TaxID=52824 RepID=A0A8X7UJG3_BRACI|nr:hypothetical protein Bca52824_052019 [Brassica carinata]
MSQTNLPFKDGQTVEVRSFEHGYRGAWFRCKVVRIYIVEGKLYYSLKYLDYEKEVVNQKPLDVAHGSWKVGDLVDWHKDDCYWSGTVVALKKNEPLQVELYPPPRGEGATYNALRKDLRPSLEWSFEDGWTLPSADGRQGNVLGSAREM